jgi:DNA-directed RNA polymerase specialized sigma24 family protein
MAQKPGAAPVTFEVTIDLNEALSAKYAQNHDGEYYESGPPNLQRAIFDAVVDKLADRVLAEAPKDYYPSLRERAREALNEKLNAQAADIVEEALAAVITETDRFGQPKGTSRTFHEYMIEQIQTWLKAPTRDSYSGRSRSNAQNIIEGALDRKFETELRKAVEAGKAQALALVRERAAAHMAAAIGDLAENAGESRG